MTDIAVRPPRIGFEVELIGPVGSSRGALGRAMQAAVPRASLRRLLSTCSAPIPDEARPTPKTREQKRQPDPGCWDLISIGLEVRDSDGRWACRIVDDATIVDDLRPDAWNPEWWHAVTDDRRIADLALRHCVPSSCPKAAFDPLARLFGGTVIEDDHGRWRIVDAFNRPVAVATRQTGQRERVSEVVTRPFVSRDWEELTRELTAVLEPARRLGFTVPSEAAVHFHLDAEPLRNPEVFARTLLAVHHHRDELRTMVATNTRCRNLGEIHHEVLEYVSQRSFMGLTWSEALPGLRRLPFSKFCDFNFRNVVFNTPGKPTFEVRILPGWV